MENLELKKQKLFKELKLNLLVNNIFNKEYESNAWVYSYFYEGKRNKMDGYFPQAGTNFIFSVSVALQENEIKEKG